MGSVKAAVIGAVVVVVLLLLVLAVWRGVEYGLCLKRCADSEARDIEQESRTVFGRTGLGDAQRHLDRQRCQQYCERQVIRAPW